METTPKTNGEFNKDLIEGLNGFLDELDRFSQFVNPKGQLPKDKLENLTKWLKDKKEELHWDVAGGNRPTDREQTWKSKK